MAVRAEFYRNNMREHLEAHGYNKVADPNYIRSPTRAKPLAVDDREGIREALKSARTKYWENHDAYVEDLKSQGHNLKIFFVVY